MLMYRIWNVARTSVVPDNVQPFLFAFRILGESGFLYFATTITHFIVWWTPCNLAIRLASQMVSRTRMYCFQEGLTSNQILEYPYNRYRVQPLAHQSWTEQNEGTAHRREIEGRDVVSHLLCDFTAKFNVRSSKKYRRVASAVTIDGYFEYGGGLSTLLQKKIERSLTHLIHL
jgi:hypothetical protein